MPGLSAAELAGYRQTQLDHMPDACTRLPRTVAADGLGGQTVTYPAPLEPDGRPCRLGVPTRAERELVADRFNSTPHAILTAAHDTDLEVGDRVRLDTGTQTGRVVDIVGRLSTLESWETCARFAVIELAAGD